MVAAALVVLCGGGCGEPSGVVPAESSGSLAPPGLEFVPPPPGTYELPPIQPAADGAVLDTEGRRRRLFEVFGDRYVLLSLIFTSCYAPEGCPLASATFSRLHRRLQGDPELAGRVRLVTLSFDPIRDTPRVIAAYAQRRGLDAARPEEDPGPWVVLTTESPEELEPILDGYGQLVVPEVDASGRPTGSFSHMLKVFLIDPERRVRNVYGADFLHPEIVLNDLKTLVRSERGGIRPGSQAERRGTGRRTLNPSSSTGNPRLESSQARGRAHVRLPHGQRRGSRS